MAAARAEDCEDVPQAAGEWDLSDKAWAEIDESIAEADRGELIPAEVVLAELRALK